MIIKKKSLIVAFASSLVVSSVLVLTLIGYVAYIELKGNESILSYRSLIAKIKARNYSKYITISKLAACIESSGTLKGKAAIEGVLNNNGNHDLNDIVIKVKFLDNENAVIYEVAFHPYEPSLGSSNLTKIAISYLSSAPRIAVKSGGEVSFKKVLVDCPGEILTELKKGKPLTKGFGRWTGKLSSEIISVDY